MYIIPNLYYKRRQHNKLYCYLNFCTQIVIGFSNIKLKILRIILDFEIILTYYNFILLHPCKFIA